MTRCFSLKHFLIAFLFLSLHTFSFAQKDNTFPDFSPNPSKKIDELGYVKFTKSLYGLKFHNHISEEIKTKIEKFMKSNHRNYRRIGEYEIHLIRIKNKLYIKENNFPKKLMLLE